jgi:hypothetical protein
MAVFWDYTNEVGLLFPDDTVDFLGRWFCGNSGRVCEGRVWER